MTDLAEKLDLAAIKADVYVSRAVYKTLYEAWALLDLRLWLDREQLATVLPALLEEGYRSRHSLCGISFEAAVNVSL